MKTRIYAAPAVKELIHCVVVCYVMLHVTCICAMHGDHVSRLLFYDQCNVCPGHTSSKFVFTSIVLS